MKYTNASLNQIAAAYCQGFFNIPVPTVIIATAAELGRGIEGRAFPRTNQVWVRRNPAYTNMRFLLAHELAHLFQSHHHLPLDEAHADELARACCGHGPGEADY